jgi:HPt (histidine-containing phosphotransfer) domain-containing protein
VSFKDTTKDGLQEMNDAMLSQQWETVANLAHKLLPPCRHIGATGLCTILRQIEESVKKEVDPVLIKKLAEESLQEFKTISEMLNEYILKISKDSDE